MNEDFRELLAALIESETRFLVVGAFALAAHGAPRATGDLDVWVEPTPENARRVLRALQAFGAPLQALGITPADFEAEGQVVQLGLPPRRIDLLTAITGVGFEEAWEHAVVVRVDALDLPVIGREQLIRNKRALGRARDLADIEALEAS
jgi:hypothetical protein